MVFDDNYTSDGKCKMKPPYPFWYHILMSELPPELPNNLKESAISPEKDLGVRKHAWKYRDAIRVIVWLAEHGYLIIGGGAITLDGMPKITNKRWQYKMIGDIDKEANIRAAYLKAGRFLNDVNEMFGEAGDKYFYDLYFEK